MQVFIYLNKDPANQNIDFSKDKEFQKIRTTNFS